jgi:putative transposase
VRILAQAVMETEVSSQISALPYEGSAYRKGHRTRTWDTRVGTLELKISKLTRGSHFPSLLELRRRAEKALHAGGGRAYVRGCVDPEVRRPRQGIEEHCPLRFAR